MEGWRGWRHTVHRSIVLNVGQALCTTMHASFKRVAHLYTRSYGGSCSTAGYMYTRARSASAAAGVRTPCSACSGALHRRLPEFARFECSLQCRPRCPWQVAHSDTRLVSECAARCYLKKKKSTRKKTRTNIFDSKQVADEMR